MIRAEPRVQHQGIAALPSPFALGLCLSANVPPVLRPVHGAPARRDANLGERRGRLESGLHFEARDREQNLALLRGFSARMVAVKAALGPQWEAEAWDRGWTKVYETVPYEPFSQPVLEQTARRLARAMTVLQPIWETL